MDKESERKEWIERCEALKEGRGMLVCKFLDDIKNEERYGGTGEGKLEVVDFSPKGRIDRILAKAIKNSNISRAGYDMDLIPWD